MNPTMFLMLLLVFCILFSSGVSALTTFNNSLTTENMTLTAAENTTRYLTVGKNVNVTSAYLNLTGWYTQHSKTEYVDADSYVDEYLPDTNFGSSSDVVIGESGYIHRAYLRFEHMDFSSYEHVTKSNFSVYGYSGSGDGNVNISFVSDDSWTETGITYNNKPAYSTLLDSFYVPTGGGTSPLWYYANLTNQTQNESVGDKNLSIILTSTDVGTQNIWLKSKQTGAAKARLNISYDSYTSNPYLDIGGDGIKEWSFSEEFNQTNNKTSDFSSAINSYLSTCSADSYDECSVPFVFYSDSAGILNYHNLSVNSAPEARNVSIDPSPATGTDDLNCTYDFFDLTDSEADQWFLWFINDILNTNTTQVLGSGNTSDTDEIICGVRVNDGTYNSSWSNSSTLVVGDSTAPILENLSIPTTGHSDTNINITGDCVDTNNVSDIDYVRVEIRYPSASGLSPTNFTTSLLAGNVYNKTFLPAYVGTYNFSFFCKDSSGNEKSNLSTQNSLSFVSTTRPTPTDPGTTGGGGIIEIIEVVVNVSSILDFTISRLTFTVFSTPSTDEKTLLISNLGDKDFNGEMTVPPRLTKYLDFSVCDEFGECVNESVELAQGQTKYLSVKAKFTKELGLGTEGFLEFTDDNGDVFSLPVVIDRPPLYSFYSRVAEGYFRGDEKTALLVVYTVTAFSIIGAFALALMWV